MRRATSNFAAAVLLVDGQRDHRRAVRHGQRQHRLAALAPVFQIDRVDDGTARIHLQRSLNHLGFRRVDHQRRFDGHLQLLDHGSHLRGFVGPFGQRHAHIQQVRAAFHLIAGHGQNSVVIVFQQ